jgi:hypothetical protein
MLVFFFINLDNIDILSLYTNVIPEDAYIFNKNKYLKKFKYLYFNNKFKFLSTYIINTNTI